MKAEWWSCEGYEQSRKINRRGMLVGSGLALCSLALKQSALGQIALRTGKQKEGETLVVIFLRGGADGLNIVVPHGEDAYYKARPALAIARPTDATAHKEDRALDLNGFFGLHPALAPLMPLYGEGQMAFIHAIGSMDESHSHFEAMYAMERGLASSAPGDASGWLARHLISSSVVNDSALRAVAIGGTMPDSLRGASNALALDSLDDFKLQGDSTFRATLDKMYANGGDALTQAGRQTLKALDSIQTMPAGSSSPYPQSDIGQGLRQVAQLIKSDVGLEVACLDKTGWDTHVTQGRGTGILASQLDDIAKGFAAFAADLRGRMKHVTVVAQTEFGRRVHENDGFGTDHGHGSVMLLLGGGTVPGVHAKWPGLNDEQLSGPGDLQVTTDYRNVLAEILSKRLQNNASAQIFPGLQPSFPGFTA